MSATVHVLYAQSPEPRRGGPATDGRPGEPLTPPPVHPLVDALRSATAPVLLKLLRTLFEGADEALFQMSERGSPSEEERKLYFEVMRLLRLQQRRIEPEFSRAYADSFLPAGYRQVRRRDGDDIDLERFTVQATDELEERIAIGNLATKAENLYRDPLREIGGRIDFLVRDLGVSVSRQAFQPEVICGAFQASLAGLDLQLTARQVLFKLLDRFVISELAPVYQAALATFERHGIRPSTSGGANPLPMLLGAGFINIGETPASAEPPTHPGVDPETRRALEELTSSLKTYRPADAQLAAELMVCAVLPEGETPTLRTVSIAQCLSLVGQMCNEILADPHLPAPMRPLFERLRFPLIKIALADGSFFANRGHPVRRLLAEAAETAQTSRTSSPAVARRQEERLKHIAEQIDLSATFVRPQIDGLSPLPAAAITVFLDQQRAESETRRETVLNKVRRAVAQELEVHTLGRTLPGPLTQFLRAGWGPLMAARLLRHGMNGRLWIDAVNRLVQILASMDALVITSDLLAVRRELLDAVAADLEEIGMHEDRRASALEQLRRAYAEHDERVARMSPAERARAEFESLSTADHSRLMADLPLPGSTRAPAPEARAERRADVSPAAPVTAPGPMPVPPAIVVPPPAPATPPAPPVAAAPASPSPPATESRVTPPPPPASERMPTESAGEGGAEADLLARCLTSESWFRVYERDSGQTLWLKVSRYYREHDSVGFTGFDAQKTLSIRASRVLEDMISGRTEPVNPTPAQTRALTELRQQAGVKPAG